MSGRRRARLASIASLLAVGLVLPSAGVSAQAPSATVPSAAAGGDALVACGDGPAFPLAALDGPQGAELAGDGPALRLARAATTGEAGYVPRGGWMRVLDGPDRVVFATWLHHPRSLGGPLLQLTLTSTTPGATDPDAWRIASAGFCWPRVVPPDGLVPAPWTLAAPADPASTSIRIVPPIPCDLPAPIVISTPERVSVTTLAPAGGWVCYAPPSPAPITVDLGEPLGARELLDGVTDPPTLVQAAPDPAPAAPPPIDPASVAVTAGARPTAIAISHAIADALGSVPGLVEVQVVDALALSVAITAADDLVLAGPPRLCLVGPFAAPDDAGLIDRCWGDPDPGAALAPAMPRDAAGHPMLPAGVPVALDATIARGEVRCDYPPGAWQLEVVLTPLVGGHGWTDVALPEIALDVDAADLAPGRELTRLESRYCGMAHRPTDAGSPAP